MRKEQSIVETPAACSIRRPRRLIGAAIATAAAMFAFASPAGATFPASTNGLIAFSADTGSGFQIYTVRPNGHDLDRITNVVGDAVNAEWSPDGHTIAPSGKPGGSS
jgi:hypothetical protein